MSKRWSIDGGWGESGGKVKGIMVEVKAKGYVALFTQCLVDEIRSGVSTDLGQKSTVECA